MALNLLKESGVRPVCILGMHRSGTSMVTRLLHECGMYLGDSEDLLPPSAEDNREGYWENRRVLEVNEAILAAFGGTWDSPPQFPEGWTRDPRLNGIRQTAKKLIAELSEHPFWGWKDPRSCLTLEFWQELVPDLSIVLCVRHPIEVAQSLATREKAYASRAKALSLWHDYYSNVLPLCLTGHTSVTHYISYFYEPDEELARLLEGVGVAVDEVRLGKATATVRRDLWHGVRVDDSELAKQASPEVRSLFERLQSLGGPVFEKLNQDTAFQSELAHIALQKSLKKIERLEELNIERAEEIESLRRQLGRFLRLKKIVGRGVPLGERWEESVGLWNSITKKFVALLRRIFPASMFHRNGDLAK